MNERDRDDAGRPRSARPRDSLGRPLPYGSEGAPRIPDDLDLAPTETLAYAQDLLDRGQAFSAHEVLEAAWKNGPDDDHLDKVKQIYTRNRETELRTNRFWSSRLINAFHYKDDPNDIPDTSKTLARITNDNIKAAAKHFLTDSKNVYQAVRKPKVEAPAK